MAGTKTWAVTEDAQKSITHERSAPLGCAPTSRNVSNPSAPAVSAPQPIREAGTSFPKSSAMPINTNPK